ncbi:Uncharacterised protein [Vibrio cholerae]|nr:Uncharacterised protein [Vibrio cholerae]
MAVNRLELIPPPPAINTRWQSISKMLIPWPSSR